MGAWSACLLLASSVSLVLGWALTSIWVGVAVASPAFVLVLLRPWISSGSRRGDLPPDMHLWLDEMMRRTTNAIIITDAQRRTLWVNGGFTRMSGYTIREMVGRKPGEVLFGPKTDPQSIKRMAEELSEGRPFQGELLNQTKDGRDYWVAVDMQPRFDASGRLLGFMAIETNITERKFAQIEHERLLAELTGFFESTAELLCIIGEQGVLTKVNGGWQNLLGQSGSSLLGRSILDFVHNDDVDHTRRELSTLLHGGGVAEFSNRLRDTTGQWRTLEWRASAHGGLVYAAARDATEQIRMERQLREQAAHTEMALSVGGLGTWDWDISAGTLRMDERWAKGIVDCSKRAAGSSPAWSDWVHREDVWPTLRELAAHLRAGDPFEGVQFRVHQRGGGWRWIRATGRVVSHDKDGCPVRMVGTYVDVTEQELAQVRMREANERMGLALEAGRMGVWVWDLDTGGFTCDQRWAEMLGEDMGDLLEDASTLLTRVHSDDLIALEMAIERQLSGQQPYVDVQCRVRHHDGSWRWVRMFGASTEAMGDERVRKLVGIQMDVHDQVEAQAELARRETVLANTVRMAGIGGWELDLGTNSLHWSDRVCQIHEVPPGYVPSLEEAIGYYEGPDRQVIVGCIQRAIELGEPWDVECRFITAKGRRRWVRTVGESVFVDGKAVRLAGAFQDVTEQRAQREALESSNRALEVAQTISRMGSWSYDAQTEEVVWSKQLYQLFEMSPENGAPTCEEALHCYRSDDVERLRSAIAQALENGTPYALTLRRNGSSNGMRYAAVDGRARLDDQGHVIGLYGTVRDVTAEVEHEAELREARQRAEEANRSKTEFLANMSHEIRTPMTAILGYAELIDDPTLGHAERSKNIEIIKRNGQHLLSVINDILDVSKIESGRMDVERIEIRPHDLIRGVGQLMQGTAREKG
ncbi:MAG: PAS domain-containing protein, partial [Phycisphaerales bacterium JB060]